MTRETIIHQARDAGYTEVETAVGWTLLETWYPYGIGKASKLDGVTSFWLGDAVIRENPLPFSDGLYLGVWTLR